MSIDKVLSIKFPFVKLAVLFGNLFVPAYTIFLFYISQRSAYDWLFAIFIIANIMERAWETFRTTREKRREELHGDWTLVLVTYIYILLNVLVVTEYFLTVKNARLLYLLIGTISFVFAVRLRWWGIASLGSQWAIHAIGVRKIRKVRVIKLGPYKYIRHPIYLSIMMEEFGICFIGQAMWSLLFCFLVAIPSVIIRATMEESSSLRRFGNNYKVYQSQTGRFLPFQYITNIRTRRN